MKPFRFLLLVLSGLTLAACESDDLETFFDNFGGGIIATKPGVSDTVVETWLLAPNDKTVVRRSAGLALTPPPGQSDYALSFSPDVAAQYLLALAYERGSDPELHVFDARSGVKRAYASSSITEQARDVFLQASGWSQSTLDRYLDNVIVRSGWWSGDQTYVLRIQYEMQRFESTPQDYLLLYDFTDTNPGGAPVVQDSVAIGRTDPSDARAAKFDPEPHAQQAGSRLSLNNGALVIDGQSTTGGPGDAREAAGVIFLNP